MNDFWSRESLDTNSVWPTMTFFEEKKPRSQTRLLCASTLYAEDIRLRVKITNTIICPSYPWNRKPNNREYNHASRYYFAAVLCRSLYLYRSYSRRFVILRVSRVYITHAHITIKPRKRVIFCAQSASHFYSFFFAYTTFLIHVSSLNQFQNRPLDGKMHSCFYLSYARDIIVRNIVWVQTRARVFVVRICVY